MDNNDNARFGIAITAMLEAFGRDATQPRIYGYWMGLQSLTIEQVESSVRKVLESVSDSFPPPPAKLRELATAGGSEDMAISAWADVQSAIPRGAYRHIDFEDFRINYAIRSLGGWPALFDRCGSADSEKWYRLEFIKAYRHAVDRGVNGDACRPLAGLAVNEVINGDVIPARPRLVRAVDCERIAAMPNRDRISESAHTSNAIELFQKP